MEYIDTHTTKKNKRKTVDGIKTSQLTSPSLTYSFDKSNLSAIKKPMIDLEEKRKTPKL